MRTTDLTWYKAPIDSQWGKLAATLAKVVYPLGAFLAGVGSFVMAALVVLTAGDVVLRYFFNKPWIGTMEVTGFMMAVFVSFYIAYCGMQEAHVRLDLFVNKFPRRIRAAVQAFTFLISSTLCAVICRACLLYAETVRKSGEYGTMTHTPIYIFVYVIALGMALLALVWLIEVLRNLGEASKK